MTEPVIVIDPEVMNGTPCFRGTRVPFKNLIDYLEGGHSLGEFLRQFPAVTREMAVQALEHPLRNYFAIAGMVVSAPEGVARRPRTVISVPGGVSNSTVPRLPVV